MSEHKEKLLTPANAELLCLAKEYLEICRTSETGLRWKKRVARCIQVGHKAGNINKRGYFELKIKGIRTLAHRVIYLMTHEIMPNQIDHIDGNRKNNNIENLRPASKSQNSFNASMRTDNTSGVRGVHWEQYTHSWRANIVAGGVWARKRFNSLQDAKAWREEQELRLHGEFSPLVCRPNLISEQSNSDAHGYAG